MPSLAARIARLEARLAADAGPGLCGCRIWGSYPQDGEPSRAGATCPDCGLVVGRCVVREEIVEAPPPKLCA
jgi:hypothetical protein